MKVDMHTESGVTIVIPHGDIRVKTVLALKSNLEALDRDVEKKVAIDLQNVSFIDSSGIGLLANFAKRLHRRNGTLCLFNYSSDIKDLLDITGIDQAVEMYDDRRIMMDAMAGGAHESNHE